jgi:Mg2+ and Co2+ transporter CorA
LQGLLSRSESNKARLQNEITLVRISEVWLYRLINNFSQAFNSAAQRDNKTQVRIGEEAKKETSAMKAIAVVTMIFLPATFVSVRLPSARI